MMLPPVLGLRIVSAEDVEERVRDCLRPGEVQLDWGGVARRLPSVFYEIPSWDAALDTQLTRNFGLWELIDVDVREAEPMRLFPRYVPCAITVLAAHLQIFRDVVGKVVRVAANGGYRSPAHRLSRVASPHIWASAANIYRVGEEWLETAERIETYMEIARREVVGSWTRPYGLRPGYAFDHLHIDIGYVTVEPHSTQAPAMADVARAGEV
jgi:hypothetical protein